MDEATLPELIGAHLMEMPTVEASDEYKEAWWERAAELHQQALDEGYEMGGDPDDEW